MLRALLIPLLLLAVPTTAAAAPFGELPFQPAGGAAACLRPTGKPGELVRWVRGGVQVMEARADGLHAAGGVPLGSYSDCPEAAGHPNGAAVLAAPVGGGIRVAVREPGAATWGAPIKLPTTELAGGVAAAISPRGDVIVTWFEYEDGASARSRARVARRVAGAAFGPAETLLGWSERTDEGDVVVGMTAAGEAVVAYGEERADDRLRVSVRVGAATAPLGPPQVLSSHDLGAGPSLAVAPDGRALVGVVGPTDRSTVYERPPGGTFGPAQALDLGSNFDAPVLALRADGAAIVASGDGNSPVTAVLRAGPGPFGPRAELAPALPPRATTGSLSFYGAFGTNPPPEGWPELRATFTADGRALLTRASEEQGAQVATVAVPAGAPGEHSTLGGPLRWPYGLSPLTLGDGRLAVAWTDDHGLFDTDKRDGRLHLAIEGHPAAPEPAAPTVTVGEPRNPALRPAQPLRLPVRCSAACDVRVIRPGESAITDATGSLSRAGTMTVTVRPGGEALAPRRGRLRLELRSSAPGARTVRTQTVRVALRRLPAPRTPRILDARARRDGDDIVVRWRTDGPVRDAFFLVYGQRGPGRQSEAVSSGAPKRLTGRSFSVRLKDAARARYVRILLSPLARGADGREVRIKVPLT